MYSPASPQNQSVAIIGGGPAGLMAAEVLSQSGIKVVLFDSMPSVGRKFLMAGKGGMNITHSEPFELFSSRFGTRQFELQQILERFGPEQLRIWLSKLGKDTFVGSSGRVFPNDLKAAPLLRLWLHRLRQNGVEFHMRHQWQGWNPVDILECHFLTHEKTAKFKTDAIILALGGGSWSKLGSTGLWVDILKSKHIKVNPLKPANCGFEAHWTPVFRERFAGQPVKSVKIVFDDSNEQHFEQQGEFIITESGIEGSLIYALSAPIREELLAKASATLYLDLTPNHSLSWLIQKLSQPRGKMSMSNFLRKQINLGGVKTGLLRELTKPDIFNSACDLAAHIKALPLKLLACRPLEEAISTAGGVTFEELNNQLMLEKFPGVFCAGEMLDWEAPTGGYLLTASFATGYWAGLGALDWLRTQVNCNS